jgi:hypothetical protein
MRSGSRGNFINARAEGRACVAYARMSDEYRWMDERHSSIRYGVEMLLRVPIAAVLAVALGLAYGLTNATGATDGSVAVHVRPNLKITDNVVLSFRPTAPLPDGGYFYAVIVLKPYKHYTSAMPPPCAVSSNMQRTAYGYPHGGRTVRLVLTRTASRQHVWCRGGRYIGGVYAVPNPPPCEARYPCSAEQGGGGGCFESETGHRVCGVVRIRRPRYTYPAGLPAPVERGTRIVGHFRVDF